VIRRTFGTDDRGRKTIAHERVGRLQDAKGAAEAIKIDPIVLATVRRAAGTGITARDLRTQAIERYREVNNEKGLRPVKIDAAAERLASTGKIVRNGSGHWMAIP